MTAGERTRRRRRRGRRGCSIDRVRTRRYPDVEVSLTVNRGEVLGVAGLIGAGRSELAEAICGVVARGVRSRAARRPAAGDSTRRATRSARESAWCPRIDAAGASSRAMTVRENITLPALGSYARLGLVKRAAETGAARRHRRSADRQGALPSKRRSRRSAAETSRRSCSANGWRSRRASSIFDEPTQGVDVGAKAEIHRLIRRLADEGAAVVMISSDIEEIVAESDRVAVMHEGRITGILDRSVVHTGSDHAAGGRLSARTAMTRKELGVLLLLVALCAIVAIASPAVSQRHQPAERRPARRHLWHLQHRRRHRDHHRRHRPVGRIDLRAAGRAAVDDARRVGLAARPWRWRR